MIIKSLKTQENFEYATDEAFLACRKVLRVVQDGQQAIREEVSNVRKTLANRAQDIECCLDILDFLSAQLPRWNQDYHKSEAAAIIDDLKVFIKCCITDRVEVKQDW